MQRKQKIEYLAELRIACKNNGRGSDELSGVDRELSKLGVSEFELKGAYESLSSSVNSSKYEPALSNELHRMYIKIAQREFGPGYGHAVF